VKAKGNYYILEMFMNQGGSSICQAQCKGRIEIGQQYLNLYKGNHRELKQSRQSGDDFLDYFPRKFSAGIFTYKNVRQWIFFRSKFLKSKHVRKFDFFPRKSFGKLFARTFLGIFLGLYVCRCLGIFLGLLPGLILGKRKLPTKMGP
jgi:hypothetical protein